LLNRSLGKLNSANHLVFDCDGVLVDSRNSYDSTIIEVLNYIFRPLRKKSPIDRTQIEKLRESGLYNNEWDAVYALTVFIFSQLSRESAKAILFWLKCGGFNQASEEINEKSLQLQFKTFLSSLKTDPISDVDKYAISTCNKKGTLDEFQQLIEELGVPLNPSKSSLVKLFDSIYYGNKIYKKIYGSRPILTREGLIGNERAAVNEKSFKKLGTDIGLPFFMLTGRSRIGVEHVLGSLIEYFDLDSSIFIEDVVRRDNKKAIPMKKPSPLPLLNLAGNSVTLYVGDSSEDVLMANNAKKSLTQIMFAGITGLKEDPLAVEKFFIEQGADLIVKSVDDLATLYTRGFTVT